MKDNIYIKKLVAEKVLLQNKISCSHRINIYGMSIDEQIELELQITESLKRICQLNYLINNYIEGKN